MAILYIYISSIFVVNMYRLGLWPEGQSDPEDDVRRITTPQTKWPGGLSKQTCKQVRLKNKSLKK